MNKIILQADADVLQVILKTLDTSLSLGLLLGFFWLTVKFFKKQLDKKDEQMNNMQKQGIQDRQQFIDLLIKTNLFFEKLLTSQGSIEKSLDEQKPFQKELMADIRTIIDKLLSGQKAIVDEIRKIK